MAIFFVNLNNDKQGNLSTPSIKGLLEINYLISFTVSFLINMLLMRKLEKFSSTC
jgi:hypothetical protein